MVERDLYVIRRDLSGKNGVAEGFRNKHLPHLVQ